MKLSDHLLSFYLSRSVPFGVMDDCIRQELKIPDNRYYNISLYPDAVLGNVTVERERIVRAKKISKSDKA